MMMARAGGRGSGGSDQQAAIKPSFTLPTSSLIGVGLVLLALALRLYDLTGESLWYDEAYSVWISDMDVGSLRVLWEWKVEFPLYYLLFHYWLRLFGQGEFAVRLFGALAGTATIVPVYLLGRELFDHKVGVFGALLLAVNPYHVWYSQEVRMHSWAVLLTVASLYCFWRLTNGGRGGCQTSFNPPQSKGGLRPVWWLGHILITGLSFHLHYYIIWIVLVENVYYLLHLWRKHGGILSREAWRSLRLWILDQLAVLLLAIPAAVVFLERFFASNDWGWLVANYRAPGLHDVLGLFEAYVLGMAFPGPSPLRWVILLGFLALAGWGTLRGYERIRRGAPSGGLGLVLLTLALPVTLVFVLGQFVAVWVIRYLLLFLPAFLLLVALGVRALGRPALGAAAMIVLVAASLYALSGMYSKQQKEDWRGVAAYISAHAAQDDLIVLMDEECRVPFSYYYGSKGARVEVSRFADGTALDRAVAEIEHRQRGGSLWLVESHAEGAALEKRLEAVAGLRRAGSPAFVGVKLVHYEWFQGA